MDTKLDGNAFPSLVVIFRGLAPEDVVAAADVLVSEGVKGLEVTLNSPEPYSAINQLATRFDGHAIVGAGTVRHPADVVSCKDSGARFIVSPDCVSEVIHETMVAGLISIPGALTPSEITKARATGANIVKVFPAAPVGANYFRLVRDSLDDIPLFASGGVTADLGRELLEAGCVSVGVGVRLLVGDTTERRDWIGMRTAAREYLATLATPA